VLAQVDGAGSLRVGDGTGPMTVDGTVRTTSSDGAVLLLNRVIPATSSGAVAAAATTTITQYRHQRMYVYSRCTATSGACDTAEVWAHVGTTNALLLALPVFSFPGPNAGGQTPTATKSNDYIADRLTFFVRRGSNTDLAAPQITIVVYGVK
jgi:hypothetical protein